MVTIVILDVTHLPDSVPESARWCCDGWMMCAPGWPTPVSLCCAPQWYRVHCGFGPTWLPNRSLGATGVIDLQTGSGLSSSEAQAVGDPSLAERGGLDCHQREAFAAVGRLPEDV